MTERDLFSEAADPRPTSASASQESSPKDRGVPAGTGALIVAAIAAGLVTAGIIALRDPVTPARFAVQARVAAPAKPWTDPLAERLAACRTATEDPDGTCQAAWDAHRRRFLGTERRAAAPEATHRPTPSPASGER